MGLIYSNTTARSLKDLNFDELWHFIILAVLLVHNLHESKHGQKQPKITEGFCFGMEWALLTSIDT